MLFIVFVSALIHSAVVIKCVAYGLSHVFDEDTLKGLISLDELSYAISLEFFDLARVLVTIWIENITHSDACILNELALTSFFALEIIENSFSLFLKIRCELPNIYILALVSNFTNF